ncbi:MAG: PEP-CTERM sorting domain-containing protein [Akkermansia sp.]|nr:PEP-CTERM sorting domain-containing protein [Akkermansia sp.]
MKKTIIALMVLAGAASAAVQSGSYTLSMEQWTTDDSTLYDYLNGAFNEGGTLTLDLTVNYTGTNCNAYQTLLHVGQVDTGFSIYANGGPRIIISEKHNTDRSHESTTDVFETGTNNLTVTITGSSTPGTASVSVTKGDNTYTLHDLSWANMGWSTSADERNKYSVNVGAPGWENLTLAQSNTLTAATATFTALPPSSPSVPEPTTATLSLLALAALAARRRRK